MFSGIVESTGVITSISVEGSNKHFTIQSDISKDAYIDQSIAHNGVCLTVVSLMDHTYTVTAIKETLDKSNLDSLAVGDIVNLERSILANSRVDGHFVQGHVDTVAVCQTIKEVDGSWYFGFKTAPSNASLMVSKGSICINGVSLTLVDTQDGYFSVAIIPYTYEHTNFNQLRIGDLVNIEFDILGKYIINYLSKIHPSM